MSNIFIAMLLSHFVGDFYLQTKKSVTKKDKKYLNTLIHSVIYSIPGILISLLYKPNHFAIYFAVFAGSHLLIDTLKFLFIRHRSKQVESKTTPEAQKEDVFSGQTESDKKSDEVLMVDWVYFADQAAHILAIIGLCLAYLYQNGDIVVSSGVIGLFNIDVDFFNKIMKALLIITIIMQPISITFGKIFNIKKLSTLKTEEDAKRETIKGAGTVIGFLERLIIITLLFLGEYEAIGLVIAAKSIARFNGDVKAEFYIIGTFYGVVSTVIPFVLIWKL